MVNSKQGVKAYFLPVYAIWAFVTPTVVIFLNWYVYAADGVGFFQGTDWSRVPAIYALFGLIWPLTLVVSPAILIAIQNETGYTFFQSFASFNDPNAVTLFISTIFFVIAWAGPLIHFVIAVIRHKNTVQTQQDDPTKSLGWVDYFAGFI